MSLTFWIVLLGCGAYGAWWTMRLYHDVTGIYKGELIISLISGLGVALILFLVAMFIDHLTSVSRTYEATVRSTLYRPEHTENTVSTGITSNRHVAVTPSARVVPAERTIAVRYNGETKEVDAELELWLTAKPGDKVYVIEKHGGLMGTPQSAIAVGEKPK